MCRKLVQKLLKASPKPMETMLYFKADMLDRVHSLSSLVGFFNNVGATSWWHYRYWAGLQCCLRCIVVYHTSFAYSNISRSKGGPRSALASRRWGSNQHGCLGLLPRCNHDKLIMNCIYVVNNINKCVSLNIAADLSFKDIPPPQMQLHLFFSCYVMNLGPVPLSRKGF